MKEIAILRSMDHPNIVRFHESYQDEKYFHLVMEYCSGGELLEYIIQKKYLTEREAKEIMVKIFSAVKYLHDKKICHRDLKPDNFLFSRRSPDAEIKLIDFGLSSSFAADDFKHFSSQVGTALYMAPEVYSGKYDEKCDYWSLGVILHILLSGNPPFIGRTSEELKDVVKKGKVEFADPGWKTVSFSAKDLIRRLLMNDPSKRIKPEEALQHPWLKGATEAVEPETNTLDPKVFSMLKNFRSSAKLRKEALRVMVNMLSEKEIKEMREAFKIIDKDNSGEITIEELQKVMNDLGFKDVEKEIDEILKTLEIDRSEGINYTDFLSATLDSKIYLNKEKLWAAFKYFDVDDTNSISIANMREAMARSGRKMPDEELKQMIKDVDISKDGKISFDEFVDMMRMENEHEKTLTIVNEPMKTTTDDIREFRAPEDLTMEKSPIPQPMSPVGTFASAIDPFGRDKTLQANTQHTDRSMVPPNNNNLSQYTHCYSLKILIRYFVCVCVFCVHQKQRNIHQTIHRRAQGSSS
eukprot:TRINITY_DN1633_c0_g1_i2.p1 TRINITY_DN1633_c0_g1~~TRINITY_DN1633_c0_g1_i2.p1  ORF type:complete len:524 (+),score=82.99 TRINITY_DN1633_c0_g1_i2:397-1968(+)